jgi:hypothetical protein
MLLRTPSGTTPGNPEGQQRAHARYVQGEPRRARYVSDDRRVTTRGRPGRERPVTIASRLSASLPTGHDVSERLGNQQAPML